MPKSTAKKRLTPNQKIYKKHLSRIKSSIKRAEARGYRFDYSKINLEMPKTVQPKSIERIKHTSIRNLYKYATYLDPSSGKTVSGTEGRVIERRAAYYKGREKQMATPYKPIEYDDDYYYWMYEHQYDYTPPDTTTDILQNVEDLFEVIDSYEHKDSWSPEFRRIKTNDKNMLVNMLTGAISQLGERQVAENIEANANELKNQIEAVLYGSSGDKKDGVQPNLLKIHEMLFQRAPDMAEAEQYMEEHENWGDTTLDYGEYEPED